MDLLEQARQIINETDEEMARLFVRRMEAVAMVAEHKKMNAPNKVRRSLQNKYPCARFSLKWNDCQSDGNESNSLSNDLQCRIEWHTQPPKKQ